jgi:hypothetical protein
VGHGHSAGRLRRLIGGPRRNSAGFKRIQNNPNLIQTRPKLDLIQIGPSVFQKFEKIWMESTLEEEQLFLKKLTQIRNGF